jgi:hypothetical protein
MGIGKEATYQVTFPTPTPKARLPASNIASWEVVQLCFKQLLRPERHLLSLLVHR